MFIFSVEELANRCGVSIPSLYNLFKKNKDFIGKNSKRYGHRIKYNQEVLNFCLEYYGKQETPTESENKPLEAPSPSNGVNPADEAIAALEAKLALLEEQLANKEKECSELIKQNGALLLLLSQEKHEKQLLLPPPKKSFSEKLKSLFGGKAQE